MDGKKEVSSVHSLATSPPTLSLTHVPFNSGPGESDSISEKEFNQMKLQYTFSAIKTWWDAGHPWRLRELTSSTMLKKMTRKYCGQH